MKIDTQGHDLAVIQGAVRTLAADRPFVIAEVIYLPLYQGQSTPAATVDAMAAQGYEPYKLFNIHATVGARAAQHAFRRSIKRRGTLIPLRARPDNVSCVTTCTESVIR